MCLLVRLRVAVLHGGILTIQLGEFRLLKAILYMFVIYINT